MRKAEFILRNNEGITSSTDMLSAIENNIPSCYTMSGNLGKLTIEGIEDLTKFNILKDNLSLILKIRGYSIMNAHFRE